MGVLCSLFGIAIWIVGFIIWASMLLDCLMNEPSVGNDKVIWAIVIIVLPVLGSILYYFIRRPERIRTYGK